MYQRKQKDDFCKKLEQMIVGRNKRQCNNIDVNNIQIIQTTNTNINDTTNIIQHQRQQR